MRDNDHEHHGEGQMGEPAKKEWCRPMLQKLPIGATAHSGKGGFGDEGGCTGKGDAGRCQS